MTTTDKVEIQKEIAAAVAQRDWLINNIRMLIPANESLAIPDVYRQIGDMDIRIHMLRSQLRGW